MCRKCAPLCKEYGLNGKKGEYEEWAEEYENKATEVRSAFRLAAGKLPMISASWKNIARKWRVSSIADPSPTSYFWSPIYG